MSPSSPIMHLNMRRCCYILSVFFVTHFTVKQELLSVIEAKDKDADDKQRLSKNISEVRGQDTNQISFLPSNLWEMYQISSFR